MQPAQPRLQLLKYLAYIGICRDLCGLGFFVYVLIVISLDT